MIFKMEINMCKNENFIMKLNELLLEATFDLDEQVDYIWDKYFAEHSRNILANHTPSRTLKIISFESINLPPSKAINAANKINPVHIVINDMHGDSAYFPYDSKISLSFNGNAYNFICQHGNLDNAITFLKAAFQPKQARNLINEFTETRVKGSIYHELSHWLDDTLHNSHLKNMLGKAKVAEPNKRHSIMTQNQPGVALTTFEINAQVHNVKQLKRNHGDEWDKLSFDDMIVLNPSLYTIYTNAKALGYDKKWKNILVKRMYREDLLGKNMRP